MEFPGIYGKITKQMENRQTIIDNQKQEIISLKNQINHLNQIIKNLDKQNKK